MYTWKQELFFRPLPRYLIIEFSAAEEEQVAKNEDILAISKRLIEKNREAYEVLAK